MHKVKMLVRNIQPNANTPSLDLYPPKELATQYGWEDGQEVRLSLNGGADWLGTVGVKKTNPPYLRRRLYRAGQQMSLSQWVLELGAENLDTLDFDFQPPNRFIYRHKRPQEADSPSSKAPCATGVEGPSRITEILEKVEQGIDPAEFFPAHSAEASRFAVQNPFAFMIATCLDRGTRSDIIWSIPYDLYHYLGHLEPRRIAAMQRDELDRAVRQLPHRPRYIHTAADTLLELSRLIVDTYGGDTTALWRERSAQAFRSDLMRLTGVGPGLANMAVQLVLRVFGDQFTPGDRRLIDIKSDVHTRRVLHRLGVADKNSDEAALQAARRLKPDSPGSLDAPLWWVGRTWCHSTSPDCLACPLGDICPYSGPSDKPEIRGAFE